MKLRFLVGMTALTLLAAACSSDTSATTTTSAPTTTSSSTTTTTESTVTTTTSVGPEPADVVFIGGGVVTMTDAGTVESLAYISDRIVALGSEADTAPYIGSSTIVIDLEERALLPGFVDPHTHLLTDTEGLDYGQEVALAVGITSIGDGSAEQHWPQEFIDYSNAGDLKLRVSLYLTKTNPCGDDDGDWYKEWPAGSEIANRVRIAGIKIFEDGGVCSALAVSDTFLEGYVNGDVYHDLETLAGWMQDADAGGYQILVHAIGDLAIERTMDAYAMFLTDGENPLRHRIDHNSFITPRLDGRYQDIGLVAVIFAPPPSCTPDRGWTDFYKTYGDRPDQIGKTNPETIISWHGDDPWIAPVSPILDLYSLVTRAEFAEDGSICEPADWIAGSGIPIEEGLAMMTVNAAYALGTDEVGSLKVGNLADLIVLSANPLTIPIGEVPAIQVLATMIGGGTEYCVEGAEQWCPGW